MPKTGTSQIRVYLPDNSTLQATNKTQLPFKQLSAEAREANILPGLTKSLLSVNKMAENRYICCRLSRYVPYKGTFVPYDGTFGASDQGQTLDV